MYQCHCSLCKKATGTSSCSALVTGLDSIKWARGKDNITSYTTKNGFRTGFCSTCGSPVPNRMNISDYIWIPAGVLEGSLDGKIATDIFTDSKAAREEEAYNCKDINKAPEDLQAFMVSLHDK